MQKSLLHDLAQLLANLFLEPAKQDFHISQRIVEERINSLEPRQYKNDSIQSKIIPILKLARFFPHCLGGEKERQFQS